MPSAHAQALAGFDFTKTADAAQWRPEHDITRVGATPEGLRIEIGGSDPYMAGGTRDLPAGQPLWMRMRLRSDQGGMAQLFYTANAKGITESNSIRFHVRAGAWADIKAPLPALGPAARFRFDPPGSGGVCLVQSLMFEARTITPSPDWPPTTPPRLNPPLFGLSSGDLQLIHGPQLGGFKLVVQGETMAVGHTHPLLGYSKDGRARWLDLGKAAAVTTDKVGPVLTVTAIAVDEDGARWEIAQTFSDTPAPGALGVRIQVKVDQDRDVLFLPLLILLPGAGSFGESKGQAVFPGVEYLDKNKSEVSSSVADIAGAGSHRKIPDAAKITVPLMAIQAHDRYVGIIWQPNERAAAFFDSPDRTFGGGGHVMALISPGSDGLNREESSLIPYETERLVSGMTLEARGVLIGGKGGSIQPALQQYVRGMPLPPLPESGLSFGNYLRLATAAWLDSKVREGDLYRHAWPGSFKPRPAADAAVWMQWLARHASAPGMDTKLSQRLLEASKAALARVDPARYNTAQIGHIRYPVASLLYGSVAENVERARQEAKSLLTRFEPDGSVLYRKTVGGLDYGKTHYAPDSNGLTGQVVLSLLRAASLCGDKDLIAEGIKRLHGLDRFMNTVPRGAQTWEVPLHTPDILAAAYLLRAYTLGYELTGDEALMEHARYWAWTGIPFVYLVNPTNQPVGPYSTIAVVGATQWVAPNWMGLPVQWCGLVYADALYWFQRYDPGVPWKKIADGITASGLQQAWPLGKDPDRVGLLSDSFALRSQMRNDAAINPATLLVCAQRLYNRPAVYDYRVFRAFEGSFAPLIVHAPGEIVEVGQKAGKVVFKVNGWSGQPYRILLAGMKSAPRIVIDGKVTPLTVPHAWLEMEGYLVLQVQGQPMIEVYAR